MSPQNATEMASIAQPSSCPEQRLPFMKRVYPGQDKMVTQTWKKLLPTISELTNHPRMDHSSYTSTETVMTSLRAEWLLRQSSSKSRFHSELLGVSLEV